MKITRGIALFTILVLAACGAKQKRPSVDWGVTTYFVKDDVRHNQRATVVVSFEGETPEDVSFAFTGLVVHERLVLTILPSDASEASPSDFSEEQLRIRVYFPESNVEQQKLKAKIHKQDPVTGIALLRTDEDIAVPGISFPGIRGKLTADGSVDHFSLSTRPEPVNPGDEIYTVRWGYSSKLPTGKRVIPGMVHRGHVTSMAQVSDDLPAGSYFTDLPQAFTSPGSGVFNKDGRLIGINWYFAFSQNEQRFTLPVVVVPASTINAFLKEITLRP